MNRFAFAIGFAGCCVGHITLGLVLLAASASCAVADPVTIRATGAVDKADGGDCTPFDTGFCDFFKVIPSASFLATYPVGLPLALTYTVDASSPNTSGDPNMSIYQALQSASVNAGPSISDFSHGQISLNISQGPIGPLDSARFEVQKPSFPQSGGATKLVWLIGGNDIFPSGGVPAMPRPGWISTGALSFGDVFIIFTLTDIRQIPEPASLTLAAPAILGLALLVRPKR